MTNWSTFGSFSVNVNTDVNGGKTLSVIFLHFHVEEQAIISFCNMNIKSETNQALQNDSAKFCENMLILAIP